MRVKTLSLIFLLLLIPDVLFVIYFAQEAVAVQSFLEKYVSSWIPSSFADNLLAIVVFGAFLYAIIFGSALLYLLASSAFKRLTSVEKAR